MHVDFEKDGFMMKVKKCN